MLGYRQFIDGRTKTIIFAGLRGVEVEEFSSITDPGIDIEFDAEISWVHHRSLLQKSINYDKNKVNKYLSKLLFSYF